MNAEVERLLAEALDDRDRAMAALNARGLGPIGQTNVPPSPTELRCDYWFYVGKVEALTDLRDNVGADDESQAA